MKNLSFHLKTLEKSEQIKTKVRLWYSLVEEHLPNIHKDRNLILSITKTNTHNPRVS